MQDQKQSQAETSNPNDFSQHFPDPRLTPHLSYSPASTNVRPELFTPTHHHHPFILPKPSFYSPFPNMDKEFIPTEQLMQMFFLYQQQ